MWIVFIRVFCFFVWAYGFSKADCRALLAMT